ncbi:hypothetical protein ACS0TY_008189 [Phlomoides rotata]
MLLKGMEFDTAHFITDVSDKYPRLWALKGAHPVTVNRWYKFGVLASIRTIAPGFREILELPDWVGHLPHLLTSWLAGLTEEGFTPPLYKKLRVQKERHQNSENRKKSEHERSEQFLLLLHYSIRAFGHLFLYSSIHKPKKYLRLKVENELRLCWVLLKEFRTTVSPAAVE